MADSGAVAASTIAIGQTVTAYQFFLPRLSDVRRADSGEPEVRGDVVMGQLAAGALSIGVGAMISWLTGSAIPVMIALFTAGIIAAIYHYAMCTTEAMS
jgi:hypothetical protein